MAKDEPGAGRGYENPAAPLSGDLVRGEGATPRRVFIPERLAERLDRALAAARAVSAAAGLTVELAYSVKTNPDARILAQVERAGLSAEVISEEEAAAARAAGFASARILRNGPVPLIARPPEPYRAVFADSLESLEGLAAGATAIAGLRLRPPGINSRFGLPTSSEADLARIVKACRACAPRHPRFGFAMHLQSSVVGADAWQIAVEGFLDVVRRIVRDAGLNLTALDLGGGWTPADFDRFLSDPLPDLAAHIRRESPSVHALFLEPGKALVEDAMALVCRVLERRRRDPVEIVVDASLAELPMAKFRRHPVSAQDGEGRLVPLGRGRGRILGRLCMEQDILSRALHLPDWIEAGTRLVFDGCGAYDASLAVDFGRGGLQPG